METKALLVGVDEAAKLLNLGKAKVYSLIAEGQIPHMQIGRSLRLPVDGLRRWIEEQTKGKGAA